MRTTEHDPNRRIAQLRTTLLGGRGPGASTQEISGHTRDRAWLDAEPAPAERAPAARPAGSGIGRAVLVGVAAALAAHPVLTRLMRTHRPNGTP